MDMFLATNYSVSVKALYFWATILYFIVLLYTTSSGSLTGYTKHIQYVHCYGVMVKSLSALYLHGPFYI